MYRLLGVLTTKVRYITLVKEYTLEIRIARYLAKSGVDLFITIRGGDRADYDRADYGVVGREPAYARAIRNVRGTCPVQYSVRSGLQMTFVFVQAIRLFVTGVLA
jgi:hypothetical protein